MRIIKKSTKKRKRVSGNLSTFMGFSKNTHNNTFKTPRSDYYDIHFNNAVTLLEKNIVYQVSFNNVSQFYNYVYIYPNTLVKKRYPDCVLQSFFAIGMRNISALYKDVDKIVKNSPKNGVTVGNITEYMATSFGLNKNMVSYSNITYKKDPDTDISPSNTYEYILSKYRPLYEKVTSIYHKHIHPYHATTMTIMFLQNYVVWHHNIVVFKHNNEIIFFDPQMNIISNSLETMYKSFQSIILEVTIYIVYGVDKPIKLINSSSDNLVIVG